MPKTRLQNIIFTLIMAFVMVYAMVCYNIALDKGGMTNEIFLLAFYEIPIMWPGSWSWSSPRPRQRTPMTTTAASTGTACSTRS